MRFLFLILVPFAISFGCSYVIAAISSARIKWLLLILFIQLPIMIWFSAAYLDSCWPNSIAIGKEHCMWVGFGMLVFTPSYFIWVISAFAGYYYRRRQKRQAIG
jgi:hypothetical protein